MIGSSRETAAHSPLRGWRGRFRVGRRAALLAIAVALIAAEQVWFLVSSGSDAKPRASSPVPATLAGRVSALVAAALGPGDRGVRRFRINSLAIDPAQRGLRTVTLTWAVNGDISLGSVGDGAHADVYLVMRALYTAHLPIGSVRMTGTFGEQDRHKRDVEVPVLVVGLDRATAQLVDWQDMDASEVWPLVHRYYERPGFECNCQE